MLEIQALIYDDSATKLVFTFAEHTVNSVVTHKL
jgi:hypothetical protein